MDRFNSSEYPDWDSPGFNDGIEARRQGKDIRDCPFPQETWKAKNWKAGWADADMDHMTAEG